MTEEWRDVPGYEGYYRVSNFGQIKSLDRWVSGPNESQVFVKSRMISQKTNGPYAQVGLFRNGKRSHLSVHVLVALVFIGPRPSGHHVCHNDGDAYNNSVENLRYDTPQQNLFDIARHGRSFQLNKTHCKSGHEFTPENTASRLRKGKVNPYRVCLICKRRGSLAHWALRRDAKLNAQEKLVLKNLCVEREQGKIDSGTNKKGGQ